MQAASAAPLLLLLLSAPAYAAASTSPAALLWPRHAHHDGTPPDPTVPLDGAIWAHMDIQMLCWGILFPAGMVLGLTRSKWHVPWQSATTLITLAGFQLGHHHGGRRFYHTVHGTFAHFCFWFMLAQVALGIFCKLHIYEDSLRPPIAKVHSIFGKLFPLVSWSQIVFGFITLGGFCFDNPGDHLGQCLAHHIMGSSFQAYGIVLLLMARYGSGWLRRKDVSQEWLDSIMITCWGIFNTFTEHDFLHKRGVWSHKDMQHTSLGVIWWAGGSLGIWLGRNRRRNVVPALIIAITGFAMSAHAQSSMLSTKVHQIFGAALIAAGFCRIVEICFVLKEEHGSEDRYMTAFQHLSPLLLVVSGMTFQSANEEQLQYIESIGMDHVTYALLIFSGSFVLYLYVNLLMALWENSGRNAPDGGSTPLPSFAMFRGSSGNHNKNSNSNRNGYLPVPLGQQHPEHNTFNSSMGQEPSRTRQSDAAEDTDEEQLELTDAYWAEPEVVEARR